MPTVQTPIVLLLHEGELGDVRDLLERLGVAYVEWRGSSTSAYAGVRWDVVVSGASRMLTSDLGERCGNPVRVAMLEQDSPGERAALRRRGIEYAVAQPVHPGALEVLLLHLLYEGPERRRSGRLSVGARVHFRTGLRRYPAVLLELGSDGCRLEAQGPPRLGRPVSIYLPAALGGGATCSLQGKVVRVPQPDPNRGGPTQFALAFGERSAREERALSAALDALAEGPVTLEPEGPVTLEPEGPATLEPRARAGCSEAPAPPPEPEPEPGASVALRPAERRVDPRHSYGRRIVSLDEESVRVLVGRDLSPGCLRVQPRSDLPLGTELRLAVYGRRGEEPLVVQGRVERDDGAAGLLLRFRDLSAEARERLRSLSQQLPLVTERNELGEDRRLLLSRILAPA